MYLIKNGLCIFNFEIGPIEVDPNLISGFLDALQQFSYSLLEKMDSINFQNLKLIYTPLTESTFMATLIDGDEPEELVRKFLEKGQEIILKYENLTEKNGWDTDIYSILAPEFTELLLSLPCPYLRKALRGFKCFTDDKKIDDKYRETYCNCRELVKCERLLKFLKLEKLERYDTVFELNESKGYTLDNIIQKIQASNLEIKLTREMNAILLNLDKGYTVMDFIEGLRENFASDITPSEVLEILEKLEAHDVVTRVQRIR